MRIIVNNTDTYDIGHDDSINEYILYVCTDDGVMVKAFDKIYGENVLEETITVAKKSYPGVTVTLIDLSNSVEEHLDA